VVRPVRVLVAHPDGDVRVLCRVALEAAGHRVSETADVTEAASAVRDAQPDVALVGAEVGDDDTDLVAAVLAEIPVVVLAGSGEDALDSWRAGASEHLSGPLSPEVLVQVVTDVLVTRAEEREARRRALLEGADLLGGDAPEA
jgi:DNA-binding NtrC family response regulator